MPEIITNTLSLDWEREQGEERCYISGEIVFRLPPYQSLPNTVVLDALHELFLCDLFFSADSPATLAKWHDIISHVKWSMAPLLLISDWQGGFQVTVSAFEFDEHDQPWRNVQTSRELQEEMES